MNKYKVGKELQRHLDSNTPIYELDIVTLGDYKLPKSDNYDLIYIGFLELYFIKINPTKVNWVAQINQFINDKNIMMINKANCLAIS